MSSNLATHFFFFKFVLSSMRASQVALEARNLPINAGDARDMGSLGREDPLEEEMATHSNILAWKIPWTEEPGRLQSMQSQSIR